MLRREVIRRSLRTALETKTGVATHDSLGDPISLFEDEANLPAICVYTDEERVTYQDKALVSNSIDVEIVLCVAGTTSYQAESALDALEEQVRGVVTGDIGNLFDGVSSYLSRRNVDASTSKRIASRQITVSLDSADPFINPELVTPWQLNATIQDGQKTDPHIKAEIHFPTTGA